MADLVCEAEYIAISNAVKEAKWLWKFIDELGMAPFIDGSVLVYCDSTKVIAQTKEALYHTKGKHIERKFHLIYEIVQQKEVEVLKIASLENLIDSFTKTLMGNVFTSHVKEMEVRLWQYVF